MQDLTKTVGKGSSKQAKGLELIINLVILSTEGNSNIERTLVDQNTIHLVDH